MIIEIATPEDKSYAEISDFAKGQYAAILQAKIDPRPAAFAFAEEQGRICGCMALYKAGAETKLQIEMYFPTAFQRVFVSGKVERLLCGELGTRTVDVPLGFRSTEVSIALAAALITHAQVDGLLYLGFTSNRSGRAVAQALELELVELGEPDLSLMNENFRKNWKGFFRTKQICFVFRIRSTDRCRAVLQGFKGVNIYPGPILTSYL